MLLNLNIYPINTDTGLHGIIYLQQTFEQSVTEYQYIFLLSLVICVTVIIPDPEETKDRNLRRCELV